MNVKAELLVDSIHGPIINVYCEDRCVSIYLTHETGVVTLPDESGYGIEVRGPWHKLRSLFELPTLGSNKSS